MLLHVLSSKREREAESLTSVFGQKELPGSSDCVNNRVEPLGIRGLFFY